MTALALTASWLFFFQKNTVLRPGPRLWVLVEEIVFNRCGKPAANWISMDHSDNSNGDGNLPFNHKVEWFRSSLLISSTFRLQVYSPWKKKVVDVSVRLAGLVVSGICSSRGGGQHEQSTSSSGWMSAKFALTPREKSGRWPGLAWYVCFRIRIISILAHRFKL